MPCKKVINLFFAVSAAVLLVSASAVLYFTLQNYGLSKPASKAITITSLVPDYGWYGDGSAQTFYISDSGELAGLADIVNGTGGKTAYGFYQKTIILNSGIDLSNYGADYNGGKGWIPVGADVNKPFYGTFDGSGHIIAELYVNSDSIAVAGLFGFIEAGAVKNLHIAGAYVSGGLYAGGIAGAVTDGGKLTGCSVAGNIEGKGYTGGITGGVFYSGTIEECYFSGTVTASGIAGGIAGTTLTSNVKNCYSMGIVTCADNGGDSGRAGGIAGYADSGTSIMGCYSICEVDSDGYAGGIAGEMFGGAGAPCTVTNCAALNPGVKGGVAAGRVAGVKNIYGVLSNNVAFGGMDGYTMFPVNEDSPTGLNGLSKTAADLHASSGFPSAFLSSPWVYTEGKLPGLGATRAMPTHLVETDEKYFVYLYVFKNSSEWDGHGKTFALKLSTDESVTYGMSGKGHYMTTDVTNGVWKIYDGDTDTGLTVAIDGGDDCVYLNYYTVSFLAINAGEAKGSTISAVYSGIEVKNGDIVLGGKQLVITAMGAGADYYTYLWNGDGANGETSDSITIDNLASKIDVICTVTGMNTPITYKVFFEVIGNGEISATVDGEKIFSGDSVTHGAEVVFTATPDEGYRVKEWVIDGAAISDYSLNTYTHNNLKADVIVTVKFELIPVFGISLSPSGDKDFGVATTGYEGIAAYEVTIINIGNQLTGELPITLSGTNADSFVPSNSSITNIATSGSATFTVAPKTGLAPGKYTTIVTVSGENNINAFFNVSFTVINKTYVVTFEVVGEGNLTATVDGIVINSGDLIAQGKSIIFTAVPNGGYCVSGWLVGKEMIFDYTSNEYTLYNLTSDITVTAEFVLIPVYCISLEPSGDKDFGIVMAGYEELASYGVMINNIGNQPTGKLLITISGENPNSFLLNKTTITDIAAGESIAFAVAPKTGLAPGEYAATVTVSGENGIGAFFNVNFIVTTKTYIVIFSVVSGGVLTATVDGIEIISGDSIGEGKSVIFAAVPSAGFRIKVWTLNGSIISASSLYTLSNLTADVTVVAEFEPIPKKGGCGSAIDDGNTTLLIIALLAAACLIIKKKCAVQ